MRTYFDCSGSMPRSSFDQIPEETTELYLFDTDIHGPYDRLRAVDAFHAFFGGTDFRKVFEHLRHNPADAVTIVTDGYGPDLEDAPSNVRIILVAS